MVAFCFGLGDSVSAGVTAERSRFSVGAFDGSGDEVGAGFGEVRTGTGGACGCDSGLVVRPALPFRPDTADTLRSLAMLDDWIAELVGGEDAESEEDA